MAVAAAGLAGAGALAMLRRLFGPDDEADRGHREAAEAQSEVRRMRIAEPARRGMRIGREIHEAVQHAVARAEVDLQQPGAAGRQALPERLPCAVFGTARWASCRPSARPLEGCTPWCAPRHHRDGGSAPTAR